MKGAPGGVQLPVKDVYASAHHVHLLLVELVHAAGNSTPPQDQTLVGSSPGHSEPTCLIKWWHTEHRCSILTINI